jgi:tetratricopeptide (TPR) repeat protein
LQGCIAAAQACGNQAAEGACCHQLGLIAQQKGDYQEALRCQASFLELSGEVSTALLATLPVHTLRYTISLATVRVALSVPQHQVFCIMQSGRPEDTARAHFCAAECHEALGDIDSAITALETYLDMTQQSSPLAYSRACCKFGSLCHRMGQFSQVSECCIWPAPVLSFSYLVQVYASALALIAV